mgnify:CR=1 FL=1
MAKTAILGHTGFIGSSIARTLNTLNEDYDGYNSKNIQQLTNKQYDTIYCACVPGVKWYANLHPKQDYENMLEVMSVLETVRCKEFYLVSSQDCNSTLKENELFTGLPPTVYGTHRLYFEWFIEKHFNSYIIRIGCLFGDGLKKNIIYDLLNDKCEALYNQTYQLYCIDNLLKDFTFMKSNNIRLMNRFSQPVYITDIAQALNKRFECRRKKTVYRNCGDHILSSDEQLFLLKQWSLKYAGNLH